MLTFIATPILMAGVLVQAYRGFKAHKNNDIDAQNRFLKIIVMLACVQCIEGVTDFMSWFPGYCLVKLLIVVAVVFPTETTQRMLYDDRVVPAIFSTANLVSARLFTARAFAATELLRRTSAFSNWVLTETECVRYISDDELTSLVDATTIASQRVKSENTRRLRESLPALAPIAAVAPSSISIAASAHGASSTAPATAQPSEAVLRPQLRPSSKSSSISTVAPTSADEFSASAAAVPAIPARLIAAPAHASASATSSSEAQLSAVTMGVFSVAENDGDGEDTENMAPSRSTRGAAPAAGMTKNRPVVTAAAAVAETDTFVPTRSVALRTRMPRSRVSMM